MFYGQDRNKMRMMYIQAWKKHREKQTLEPLDQVLVNIIERHPEYHKLLEDPDKYLDKDYTPEMGETNPFLHMGMHISIQEQVSTNRPAGINILYEQLITKLGDPHEVEHQLMECLGLMLWEAQRDNRMPDEQAYLKCAEKLVYG